MTILFRTVFISIMLTGIRGFAGIYITPTSVLTPSDKLYAAFPAGAGSRGEGPFMTISNAGVIQYWKNAHLKDGKNEWVVFGQSTDNAPTNSYLNGTQDSFHLFSIRAKDNGNFGVYTFDQTNPTAGWVMILEFTDSAGQTITYGNNQYGTDSLGMYRSPDGNGPYTKVTFNLPSTSK